MADVKAAFPLETEDAAPIKVRQFLDLGLEVKRCEEYHVTYTILNLESLISGRRALDMAPSDSVGLRAERDLGAINRLPDSSLTGDRVETNEHRSLLRSESFVACLHRQSAGLRH
ncbi:MAG: hypothetical protein PXZ08_05395 [Actinomycetota bacterium]|nr:hypothetical protein [Actinomycetota bacterium]